MKKTYESIIVIVMVCLFLVSCAETVLTGGPVDNEKLIDGVYEGSASGGPNKAVVNVTIENQKIVKIEILQHSAMKGKKAEPIVPQRIIDEQSTDVDTVSGATNSSKVIMNAVQNALDKASSAQ